MTSKRLQIKINKSSKQSEVSLAGEWTVLLLSSLEQKMDDLVKNSSNSILLDASAISKIDTAGSVLICSSIEKLKARGVSVKFTQGSEEKISYTKENPFLNMPVGNENKNYQLMLFSLNEIGRAIIGKSSQIKQMVGFGGWVLVLFVKGILRPRSLRWTPLVTHMEQVGLRAVPIVALLTFLIGLVVMYMGAQQLQRFGAQVLAINLLEVATFRELGPMLTAIVVAGRSGSAFTAQIGAMVSNEELSAMRVMGFEPMEWLVLPRVLALVIMLPVLTVISDFAGTIGGAVAAWMILDMDFISFLKQFQQVANLNNYLAGLIKAPFFAIFIAIIGCYQGQQATGSAASVGALTTQAVVESIFIVITLDAGFALLFSAIGL